MTTQAEEKDGPTTSAPAVAAGICALLLWSGTPIANKVAVRSMDAMSAGLLRSMLAGACALVLALALRLPLPKGGRERGLLLVSGLTSFAIWPLLLSLGIGRTTAGHAALLLALIPIRRARALGSRGRGRHLLRPATAAVTRPPRWNVVVLLPAGFVMPARTCLLVCARPGVHEELVAVADPEDLPVT